MVKREVVRVVTPGTEFKCSKEFRGDTE
ncbi:hypothetical protein [Kineothrix sp. MB12-C1]